MSAPAREPATAAITMLAALTRGVTHLDQQRKVILTLRGLTLLGRGGARGARRGRVADPGLLERRDSRATPGPPVLATGGDRVLREELA